MKWPAIILANIGLLFGFIRFSIAYLLISASEIEHAAGPKITMNKVGRMNKINGTVIIAGRRAAFSSARIMRSLRNSADNTRRAEAKGVPYFSV